VSSALFNGGEIKISVAAFLRLMNSLKSIRKLFFLNFVAKLGGSQATTMGGFTSLAPPWGLTGFAQRASNSAHKRRKMENKMTDRCTWTEDFRKFAAPNLPIVLIAMPFFINFTLLINKQLFYVRSQ
jgi:hypothetical protein